MADEFNLGTAHGRIVIDSDVRGVGKAEAAVTGFEKKAKATSPTISKLTKGVGLLAAGAGVGLVAGFVTVIKSAADFQSKLSGIQADTGATGKQMEGLRKLALKLGADTKFSASEAADAIDGLAKAGIPIKDILGGAARAVTDLAAASGTDLATATDLAVSVMNQFHIKAKDLTGVVDLLTGAVNGSAADIGDFQQAMQQVGPVAAQAGLDVRDLAGFIAVLANSGLKGSDAGTSLKTAITSLISPTSKAKEEMRKLGLITADGKNKFIDAHGAVKPYDQVIALLHDHLKDLSPAQRTAALETIGGSDAMRALGIFTATTAKNTKDLNHTLDNTSAAKTAKTRMDNLKGSIEQLKGSIETLMISVGEKAQPFLKGLADSMTGIVNSLANFKTPQSARDFVVFLRDEFDQQIKGSGKNLTDSLTHSMDGFTQAVRDNKQELGPWVKVMGFILGRAVEEVVEGAGQIARVFGNLLISFVIIAAGFTRWGRAIGHFFAGPFVDFFVRMYRSVVAWLGNTVRKFSDWRGLLIGIARGAGNLVLGTFIGAVTHLPGQLLSVLISALRKFTGWKGDLVSAATTAGREMIHGIVAGGRAVLRGIGGFLGEIKDAIVGGIKRLFGIHSPASAMIPLGQNILRGLIKGLLTDQGLLRKVLGTIGGSITGFFSKLLSGGLPGIAVNLVKDLLSSGAKGIGFLGDLLGGLGGKALDVFGGIGSFFGKIFGGGSGGLPNFAGLAKQIAASLFGWVGAQWSALFNLGMGESGFSNTADNPNSTAFGIGQFLDSTWALVGAVKTLDPAKQIIAMLKYIKLIYGDPIRAFSAWMSRVPHWYDQGGIWPSGTLGLNMSGRDEYVFTNSQLAGLGGGGDTYITVEISGMKDAADVERRMKKPDTWGVLLRGLKQKRMRRGG